MSRIWTPRDDQELVMEFGRARDRWALFAPPGAGKTAIAGTWASTLMYDELALPRLVIVAPPMVANTAWPDLSQWQHLRRFAGDMRVLTAEDFNLRPRAMVIGDEDAWEMMLHEVDAATRDFCEVSKMGLDFHDRPATIRRLLSYKERIHVVSKVFWPWLERALAHKMPYHGLIIDESSGLRDPSSDFTKATRRAVHSKKKTAAKIEFVLELTGTPNANHGPAIFPQVDLIAPGLLGENLTEFRTKWCQPDTVNRQTGDVYTYRIVPALQTELAALVATVAVSVPSTLAVPLIEADVAVPGVPEQVAAYREMDETSVFRTAISANAGTKYSKLRQIAAGFCYDEASRVLFIDDSRIDRIVEDANEYGGQIVFAFNFTEELDRLRVKFGKKLKDIRETGAKQEFLDGKLKYLAGHPASMGHGVDMLQHASNQLWWLSVPDDLELYQQMNARVHRHGTSAATVYVRRYFTPGTVEERIKDEVLPGKKSVADLLLEGTSVRLAALCDDVPSA